MKGKVKVAIFSNGISQHTLNRLNLFYENPQLDLYFLHQGSFMKNISKLPDDRFIQLKIGKGKNIVQKSFIGVKIIIQNLKNILKINPDIIFIMYGDRFSLLSAFISGKSYLISAWGGDFLIDQGAQKTWKDRFILSLGIKNAAHIYAVSEELVKTISKLRGNVNEPKIQHLFYGINLNLYKINNNHLKKRFDIYAPRWCRPVYNLTGTLIAFKKLREINDNAFLIYRNCDMNDSWLAKNYLGELSEFISLNNLNDSVNTLGFLSESDYIKSLMQASVIISLTPSDGTPVTILEAMALGKIVVCGRINSLEKLIEDGVTGFLVDINDPSEIANKLNYIEQNFAELQKVMGQKARNFVENNADIHREVEIYMSKFLEFSKTSD